jgi:hypothetical protein
MIRSGAGNEFNGYPSLFNGWPILSENVQKLMKALPACNTQNWPGFFHSFHHMCA